jgi:hypothetical protein
MSATGQADLFPSPRTSQQQLLQSLGQLLGGGSTEELAPPRFTNIHSAQAVSTDMGITALLSNAISWE